MNQSYSNSANESVLFPDLPVTYGGFGDRLGAALLDGIILALANFFLQYVLGQMMGTLFSIVLDWFYYALQESGPSQATIGKKALGLKVTTLSGDRISFGQATGRYFGKIISSIILFIGYLMMLWDERKQTLHDKMAGTLVVKQTGMI